jgi:hypothetical protein
VRKDEILQIAGATSVQDQQNTSDNREAQTLARSSRSAREMYKEIRLVGSKVSAAAS